MKPKLVAKMVRRDDVQLSQWPHGAVNCGRRPQGAFYAFYFVRCDEPSNMAVILYDETTEASGKQVLIDKSLEAHLAVYSGVITLHHLAYLPI